MKVLAKSFECVSLAVDNTKTAWRLVIAMLVIHSGLLMYSAYVHSPTLNEPGHLVAGLSHWKFGRFELYRVNPPLVRMVAALPVMAVGYEEDWSGFYEGPGARPVFGMGRDFIEANGERSYFLFMIARWACIPFSWLGAIICYLWARDLYGRQAGLLACLIWCFSPNILAHASLITADAPASALGVAACYTFWRWLKKPTWAQAVFTGGVLGLAELAKTTLILFYPLWPVMWLIYRWPDRLKMKAKDWVNEAGMLVLRMMIGIYIINLGYGFEGSFQSIGDFQFVSQLFTDHFVGKAVVDTTPTNRMGGIGLSLWPIPLPENYLLGIDIQQKDFESYDRPSYLRGKWSDRGWWYYYLYAGLIKVPLGLLSLGGVCLLLILPIRNMTSRVTLVRDTIIVLTPALLVLCVVSSKTGFSEHFRYVLPVFPYLFVLASRAFIVLDGRSIDTLRKSAVNVALVFMLTWLVTSSLSIYPHSLSYFNESIGGPLNGAKHLLGSNLDWGQDRIYVKYSIPDDLRVSYYFHNEDLPKLLPSLRPDEVLVVSLAEAMKYKWRVDVPNRSNTLEYLETHLGRIGYTHAIVTGSLDFLHGESRSEVIP